MEQDVFFNLYKTCFPNIVRSDGLVKKLLHLPENHVIVEMLDGKIVGASIINAGTIIMLCVHPDYRNKGIGSKLLALSESYIAKGGFDQIKFCDGIDYIMPGIPIFAGFESNVDFFTKRGYVHSWGDNSECVDMAMDLADFSATQNVVGDQVGDVLYRWAEKADYDAVLECVQSGHEGFVEYYKDDFLYEDSTPFEERILTAQKDGKVCGALLVGNGTDAPGLGSVGCTVTRPEYRNQGIATTMVKLGTHHLKLSGLKKAFLGYTYTDIIPMYGKSGYKVCMKYFMGVKEIHK